MQQQEGDKKKQEIEIFTRVSLVRDENRVENWAHIYFGTNKIFEGINYFLNI